MQAASKQILALASKESKQSSSRQTASRHIPADLRDEIFVKDHAQCIYVSPNGVRCCAHQQLEVDHIVPFAAGGKTVLSNLRLRCKQHNLLAAEQFFGREKIEHFRREA